jgi:hypothetical protein
MEKIAKLINSVSAHLDSNTELPLATLLSKLQTCAAKYPTDSTIIRMARIVDSLSDQKLLITRDELKKIYKSTYTSDSKFASLFADELGETVKQPKLTEYKHNDFNEINMYAGADPALASALGQLFGSDSIKPFSDDYAKKAVAQVNGALDGWELKPSQISVATGNSDYIIVQASYHTTKGVTSFFVPVEIQNKKVIQPEILLGNNGPQELNYKNIKNYITTQAGNQLIFSANTIVNLLTKVASEKKRLSPIEFAAAKIAADKGEKGLAYSSVLGQTIPKNEVTQVEVTRLAEADTFEKKLKTSEGAALLQFGEQKLNTAANLIKRELESFGYKSVQMKVSNATSDCVTYTVTLDGKIGFNVPMKISNKIEFPSVLICNGGIQEFSAKNINAIVASNNKDYKILAVASNSYGLKPSDLIMQVKEAVENNNTAKIEDCLNVLRECGDAKAYATAFNYYRTALAGKLPQKEASKCKFIVKSAKYGGPCCGHLNLPLNKVFQDQFGNCQPLHRLNMSETYEGVSFMNSKVFGK